MKNSFAAQHQRVCVLLGLWLATACNRPEPTIAKEASQKTEPSAEHETVLAPSVRPAPTNDRDVPIDPGATVASAAKPSGSDSAPPETKTDNATRADQLDLKLIVKPMFSRALFKLEPAKAQTYFESIASLQQRPADESWERTFQGSSKLPWLESVLLQLQEEDGRWRLGQSQITWRPPKAQARALYERLVAEVQATRGRKPDFGEDESEGAKQQRHLGWTWCKDRCQAYVALDSTGEKSLVRPTNIDESHPAVLLNVFSPEGP